MRLSRRAEVEFRKFSNALSGRRGLLISGSPPWEPVQARPTRLCWLEMQEEVELLVREIQNQASYHDHDAALPRAPLPPANAFAAFSFLVFEDAFGDTSASEIQTESSEVLSLSESFSFLALPQEHHMTSPPRHTDKGEDEPTRKASPVGSAHKQQPNPIPRTARRTARRTTTTRTSTVSAR